jgi:hypothetical protein
MLLDFFSTFLFVVPEQFIADIRYKVKKPHRLPPGMI